MTARLSATARRGRRPRSPPRPGPPDRFSNTAARTGMARTPTLPWRSRLTGLWRSLLPLSLGTTAPYQHLGQAQADEHAGRHRRHGHDARHDGAVGDPEVVDAVDAQLGVRHRLVVLARPTGPGGAWPGATPAPRRASSLLWPASMG